MQKQSIGIVGFGAIGQAIMTAVAEQRLNVAVAGVTFLNDGQKVKLMQPQTSNALGAPTSTQ